MVNSPFPGMDPYLEQSWGDIHHRLITYASNQLQRRLPGDLRARVDERVFLEVDDMRVRHIAPDVRIVESDRGTSRGSVAVAPGAVIAERLILAAESEPATQGFIEILDVRSGRRVVTVIEFLSPSNKTKGDGRDQYIKKRDECLTAGVNFVEIDLVRAGKRMLAVPLSRVPPEHRTPYQVCVTRNWPTTYHEVYPVALREPLPTIAVPLRPGDDDVPLSIQPLIEQAYLDGRYDDIDYTVDPIPRLRPDDAAWADALLREKGLRAEAT